MAMRRGWRLPWAAGHIAITGLVLFAEQWDTLRLGRCTRHGDEA